MKIVLVTGGNRDIGYEACRQLTAREVEVVLSARSEQAGKVAVEKLSTERQKSVSIRSMSQVAANFFSQKTPTKPFSRLLLSLKNKNPVLMDTMRFSRRKFLQGVAAASLTIGLRISLARAARPGRDKVINAWVRIGSDDSVTLLLSQCEMGQGISTTLPAILADELGADWSRGARRARAGG